jgi:hypothetical protein
MSTYDFILESMRYSYSSVNTYDGCPLAFNLTYIQAEDRSQNAFSAFGNLAHSANEKYFKGELDSFELASFYKDNYSKFMTIPFPPYPAGMADNYYREGLEFFENFDFDKDKYEVISIEEALDAEFEGTKIVAKPDLILKDKETSKYILYDYKTSKIKNSKYDDKKIAGYLDQMNVYVYFIWQVKNIAIDEIRLWFVRNNIVKCFPVDPDSVQTTMEWFGNTIKKIKSEEEWKFNNKEKFFCQNICSMKFCCPHKP